MIGSRSTTVLAAFLACVLGCSHAPRPRPSLVLITIDTLRADHLHAYGYEEETSPRIDRFARDALLFENAFSPAASTLPSHVSLLTSADPARHGILGGLKTFKMPLHTDESLQTAAQMLQRAGYRTAAFTSSSLLGPETGIGAGFETFVGPSPPTDGTGRVDLPGEKTVSAAIQWLEGAHPPFFLWVHLFDPHDPYEAPGPRDRAFSGAHADYDGEILYADGQVGRLLDALERLGLYDDSITVLAADHGEGLGDHRVPRHGFPWNEEIRVPLVLRIPGGPRGRNRSLASLIDVLPTLAAAGLPLDRRLLDGIDLLSGEQEYVLSHRPMARKHPDPVVTLISKEWKYWYYAADDDRLYHLKVDPGETRNVLAAHQERGKAMREILLERLRKERARCPVPVAEVPENLREKVRSLGQPVESPPPGGPPRAGRRRADPRSRGSRP